jgi:hypothetical protein
MRSFVGDEPFEPVRAGGAGPASDATRPHRFWPPLLGLAVTLLHASRSVERSGEVGELMPMLQGIRARLPERGRKALLFAFRLTLAGLAIVLVLLAISDVGDDLGVSTLVFAAPAVLLFIAAGFGRVRLWWAEVRGRLSRLRGPRMRRAPPMRLDIYLSSELAPRAPPSPAPAPIGEGAPDRPPFRILCLYDALREEGPMQKIAGDLGRFGPVYHLGRARDLGVGRDRPPAHARARLLETADHVDAHVAAVLEITVPMVGGAPAGPADAPPPDPLFLCADESWRHAVPTLIDRADVVLVDACGYAAAGAGLSWELGQLIDRVSAQRFVVLLDSEADQETLYVAVRAAWATMSADSPNRRAGAGPVRWVIHEGSEEREPSRLAPVHPATQHAGVAGLLLEGVAVTSAKAPAL